MRVALMVLEVLVSFALIGVILLRSGRSAGISGAIGGGAEFLFGKKRGLDEFLNKVAAVLATLFLAIALLLAVIG